jgi:hypothetical protein
MLLIFADKHVRFWQPLKRKLRNLSKQSTPRSLLRKSGNLFIRSARSMQMDSAVKLWDCSRKLAKCSLKSIVRPGQRSRWRAWLEVWDLRFMYKLHCLENSKIMSFSRFSLSVRSVSVSAWMFTYSWCLATCGTGKYARPITWLKYQPKNISSTYRYLKLELELLQLICS